MTVSSVGSAIAWVIGITQQAVEATEPRIVAGDEATTVTQSSLLGFGDRLRESIDVAGWWTHCSQFLTTKGVEFFMHVVEAVAIFVIGRWVARALTRGLSEVAARANVDQTLIRFIRHLVYAAMLAFVVLSALNRLGIDTTSFTAVVGAAGLAVGFALQGSLSNFAAGVMLIMFKPFKVGDNISAGGSTGTIEEIQIFNTIFKTADNATIFVPNGAITGGTIINNSHENTRRLDLVIKCGYNDDLREVKRFLVEMMYGEDRILQLPPPNVSIEQLGDNAITLAVQPWVRSEDYSAVRSELLESIKLGFDERGFHLRPSSSSAAAPASSRSSASSPSSCAILPLTPTAKAG